MAFAVPVVLALLALSPATAEDRASEWLQRLGSASAPERELAQRWLSAHLALDDYPDLARAAARPDPELRRRLQEALASDDRHLGLVVLLSSEGDAGLEQLGHGAFREIIQRWCPGAEERPAHRSAVVERLARRDSELYALPGGDEPAAASLERLARLSDLSVPLVLAPEVQARRSAPRAGLEGAATLILTELCRHDGTSFAGVGEWREELPGPGAWVLVSTRLGVRRESGTELLEEWCQRVQGGSTGAPSAARALAATGWPAGLGWLEGRWLSRRDAAALEGLLVAAERGVVAPALTTPAQRRALLRHADTALARRDEAGRRTAERVARGLAASGAVTPGGADPAPLLIEGWESLTGGQRWVRLVALESTPSRRREVVEAIRSVACDLRPVAPELRLQALRALVRVPPEVVPAGRPGRLGELVSWALGSGRSAELAGLLVALDVRPQLEAGELAAARGARGAIFLTDWAYRAGELDVARARLLEGLRSEPDPGAPSSPWVDCVAGWVRRDGPAGPRELLRRAAAESEAPQARALDRLALLAGCAAPQDEVRLFAELAARQRPTAAELELIGHLAAGPRGQSARDRLLDELARGGRDPALDRALGRACDEASRALRRARLDREQREFARRVWRAVDREGHRLRERLAPPAWPPPVQPPPLRLDRLDRELPRGA